MRGGRSTFGGRLGGREEWRIAIPDALRIGVRAWSAAAASALRHAAWVRSLNSRLAGLVEHREILAASLYFGRAPSILAKRERMNRQTIANRRLHHRLQPA
jgi:hypothetical protein